MSVKKYQIAPFINTAIDTDTGLVDKENPVWTRIKKTTSFDLNMNPESESRDYICDENPTVELLRYGPSFSTPLVMHKGEDDYDFIFGKFANRAVGEEAKAELCLVFFQEPCDEPEEGEEPRRDKIPPYTCRQRPFHRGARTAYVDGQLRPQYRRR